MKSVLQSWRDWRVDVKSKAAKLKSHQRGTGGGGPSPAPLHEIEERLIALIGKEAVEGHSNIIDPAEVSITNCNLLTIYLCSNNMCYINVFKYAL